METLHSLLAHPLVSRLGWSLAHFVWEGAILAGILAVVLLLLRRRSASARYLACSSAMLLMVAAVPLTWCLITPDMKVSDVPALPPETTLSESGAAAPLVNDFPAGTPPAAIPAELAMEPVSAASPMPRGPEASLGTRFVHLMDAWMPWIVLVWLAGVSVLSTRLAVGWVLIQRLRRNCVQSVGEPLHAAMRRLARQLSVSRPVRLAQSTIAEVPSAIGWLRPMILLPVKALTGLTTEQIEAIIAHELAHIRRYDYLVNLAQSVVETVLFYHPAVWWVSRRMRIEREHCCDDLAVAASGDAVTYARALSNMESLRAAPRLAAAASGGSLIDRVRRVLGLKAPAGNQFARYAAGLLVAVAVFALAAAMELSSLSAVAEDKQGKEEQSTAATQPAAEPEGMRGQPHRWRYFAQIVVGENGMTFQGKAASWEDIDRLAQDIPDRNLTVLTLATTTELPEQAMHEAERNAGRLVQKYGFEYLSFVGVHPLGSEGGRPQYLPPITERGRWRHFVRVMVEKDGLWFQGRRLQPGDLQDLPDPQWTMLEIGIGIHQGSDEGYDYETAKKQLCRQAEQSGLEGVIDVGMQPRDSKGSPSLFISDPNQPGYWRYYVTLAASPDEMTFQGKKVTLDQLRDRLAALPDRPNTVFCLAVTSDKVSRDDIRPRIDPILGELGINEFSFIGVHPLGTMGGGSIFTPEAESKRPSSQPARTESTTTAPEGRFSSLPARTLRFPANVGAIYPYGPDQKTISPEILALANGEVSIPAGRGVLLRIDEKVTDLSFLSAFGPDDIQALEFYKTAIKDEALAHIAGLTGLVELSLNNDRQITDKGLEHLAKLTNLERLSLAETGISDAGLARIKRLPRLTMLNLYRVSITDAAMAHIAEMQGLEDLSFSSPQVTPGGTARLHSLPRLKSLTCIGKNLNEAVLAGLKVEEFSLPCDVGEGFTDAMLAALANDKAIKYIDILHAPIKGSGLAAFKDHPSLEMLGLYGTKITDDALVYLAAIPKLQRVVLSSTPVTDAGLAHLTNAASIRRLNLFETAVTDAGLQSLAQMPNLESLGLCKTRVTDEGIIRAVRDHRVRWQSVDVAGTKVTEAGLRALTSLVNYQLVETAERPATLLKPGQSAPGFTAKSLDGKPFKLSDYRGKVVLLHFWEDLGGVFLYGGELGQATALRNAFKGDGRFVMVGLCVAPTLERARAYLEQYRIDWPQVFLGDPDQSAVAKAYGITHEYEYFLIGPDGRIVRSNDGSDAAELLHPELLHGAIRRALSEMVVAAATVPGGTTSRPADTGSADDAVRRELARLKMEFAFLHQEQMKNLDMKEINAVRMASCRLEMARCYEEFHIQYGFDAPVPWPGDERLYQSYKADYLEAKDESKQKDELTSWMYHVHQKVVEAERQLDEAIAKSTVGQEKTRAAVEAGKSLFLAGKSTKMPLPHLADRIEPDRFCLAYLKERPRASQKPAGSIAGLVIDETGQPARDAQVFISRAGPSPGKQRIVPVNEQGIFASGPLDVGTYFVSAFRHSTPEAKDWKGKPGYLLGSAGEVKVGASGKSEVTLRAGTSTGGRSVGSNLAGSGTLEVTLAKPGALHLEWGIVFVALSPPQWPLGQDGRAGKRGFPSDQLGFFFVEPGQPFTIHNVPPGRVYLRAVPSDPGPLDASNAEAVDIQAGHRHSISLRLQPSAAKAPAAIAPATNAGRAEEKDATKEVFALLAAERPDEWQIVATSHGPLYQGRLITWDQLEMLMAATSEPRPKTMYVASTREVRQDQLNERIAGLRRRLGIDRVTSSSMSSRSSRLWEERAAPPASRPANGCRIERTILTPDGLPAEGAQVIVCEGSEPFDLHIKNGRLSDPLDEPFVTTDTHGHFVAPASKPAPDLIILHQTGFVWVRGGGLSALARRLLDGGENGPLASMPMRLERWGTVKGTLRIGQRQAAGESVSITTALPRPADSKRPPISLTQSTQTRTDGSYELTGVPPCPANLYHSVRMGDQTSLSSQASRIDVRPGQLTTQDIGGQGRQRR
jgi:beta-lactamase regulating signal transducer with metallopeptidase domain/peroxiredoxin